jgi:GTP-binding protein
MVDRGELIIVPGVDVYEGQVVGERNRTEDLVINITREKKLTNMRSSTSEATVTMRPPRLLSLDQSIEFLAEDEVLEATPLNIRMRKMELDASKRATARSKEKSANAAAA